MRMILEADALLQSIKTEQTKLQGYVVDSRNQTIDHVDVVVDLLNNNGSYTTSTLMVK